MISKELQDRLLDFAVRIVKLASELPDTPECRVIRYQLVKSGTSMGANYSEACEAESKADFKSKIGVCKKESKETLFWLQVIVKAKLLDWSRVKPDYEECNELVSIFVASHKTVSVNDH